MIFCPKTQDTMVRVGEFSPANPDLQAPLGLGEYEERRRQLLEKKKQECKEYLLQTRNVFHRTNHLDHPVLKRLPIFYYLIFFCVLRNVVLLLIFGTISLPSNVGYNHIQQEFSQNDAFGTSVAMFNKVDATTQTDSWHVSF